MITKNVNTLRQEVHEHAAADAVVQGQYWEDGRGCFIGCLAHSVDPTPAVERFGLTTPILRIAEAIFEKLPLEEARQFFCDFPDAVAVDGKDLSLVHWQFLLETLQALPEQPTEIKAVIDPVIAGINSLASGGSWDARAAGAAAEAAEAAAWDAEGAEAAEIRRQRHSLLRLIREAPTTTPAGQEEA